MRRREFMALLAGAAAPALLRPLAAGAQQPALPVIGFLTSLGQHDRPNLREAFRHGLSEAGYVEGRNAAIEYRFAENQYDRLPALATDLVGRKVAVIAATGGGNSVLAAKAATTTIPIVFLTGGDPVQEGYVASLNRPGGNLTGVNWFGTQLAAKGLGLLHELVPNAAVIGLLVDPNLPESTRMVSDAQYAARARARQLLVLNVGTPAEIDVAFATAAASVPAQPCGKGGSVLLDRASVCPRGHPVTRRATIKQKLRWSCWPRCRQCQLHLRRRKPPMRYLHAVPLCWPFWWHA
jgi:putative ABC transport system substrate-binding protein